MLTQSVQWKKEYNYALPLTVSNATREVEPPSITKKLKQVIDFLKLDAAP